MSYLQTSSQSVETSSEYDIRKYQGNQETLEMNGKPKFTVHADYKNLLTKNINAKRKRRNSSTVFLNRGSANCA
jgi:hypothetical protein